LHRSAIDVALIANKPCAIAWRMDSASEWEPYSVGAVIHIGVRTTLYFRGRDTCGNEMAPRAEFFDITPDREASTACPSDMEYIAIGTTRFCIDRYEWPNRKGAMPQSFVSLAEAMDSCASRGKRLCGQDEWMLACAGPHSWAYPYGQQYESHACRTRDAVAGPSGDKPECRGYFGVFDMSGNLLEWTGGRSRKNSRFFTVMGGFWESGSESGCFMTRYSYYPQNRHNPVGFRCCADVAAEKY
jgi:hypothetical protein